MSDSRGRGDEARELGGRTAAMIAGLALVLAAASGARAQEPVAEPVQEPAAAGEAALPLSLRYRFIERYGLAEEPGHPETIVQYQVGVVDTNSIETEKATGARAGRIPSIAGSTPNGRRRSASSAR